MPDIYHRYNLPPQVGLECKDPHLTAQEFAEEADVNNVVLRFSATGELPPRLNARVAEYLDVSIIGDLKDTLETARRGWDAFDALPEQLKAAVGYDPERLLAAIEENSRVRASTEDDATRPSPDPA